MSEIEWTDETWQVLSGCTPVSTGCRNCYSAKLAGTRLKNHPRCTGLTRKAADGRHVFTGDVRCHTEMLGEPSRRRKPRRVFVGDRGDLWHDDVPDSFIGAVLDRTIGTHARHHTYLFLTKRAQRMAASVVEWSRSRGMVDTARLWFGVSVENQEAAEERLPALAALRPNGLNTWVSFEPLLGSVQVDFRGIGWAVIGGESGAAARRCDPSWVASLMQAASSAATPVFVKQTGAVLASEWGLKDRKGADPTEWPEEWRRREFPLGFPGRD